MQRLLNRQYICQGCGEALTDEDYSELMCEKCWSPIDCDRANKTTVFLNENEEFVVIFTDCN